MGDSGIVPVMEVGNGGNRSNNDGWGDGGSWIWVIFLFFIMAWGGNGFWGNGNNGGGGINSPAGQGALTRGDLCSEFAFNGVQRNLEGITQGICDSTYALNNSINGLSMNMMQGFNGVGNAICNLGYTTQQGFNANQVAMMQGQNALQTQLADCCCTTQRAIEGVNYNMATNTCNIVNQMNNNTRDIIESQQAGTRAILDKMCQDQIMNLRDENQTLKLAASQAQQNNAIGAMIDASEANIIRRTGNDCPIPAYVVPNPNCCYNYAQPAYNNGGCGCGNC